MSKTSLYIHIPFCQKKCLYCSFVVSIGHDQHIDEYLSALEGEMIAHRGAQLETIYIGGGTPTYLNTLQLKRLMEMINSNFNFEHLCEFTVEMNPEGVDREKLHLLRDFDVSRISLGIQSLNDQYLKYLGRCHDRAAAIKTYDLLRAAGFENINVDLMCAFPQQTNEELKKDLADITSLKSEHISVYALTIEEHSRFFVQKIKLSGDEILSRQYEIVVDELKQKGFAQYEVSNFAKPGFESVHNMNYWLGGNYIGLGVGAHAHKNGKRSWNVSNLFEYLKKMKEGKTAQENFEQLSPESRFYERLIFGLRMNQGIDLIKLQEEFDIHVDPKKMDLITQLVHEEMIEQKGTRLLATDKGRLILDEISERLV